MDGLNAALARIGGVAARLTPLHGGDLSEVAAVRLEDGRAVVAKAGALVAVEARMLAAMGAAGARVPGVLAVCGQVMLLEMLKETAPSPAGWADLGAGLARLHASTGAQYGWAEDYAFGAVRLDNTPLPDWADFWARRRLLCAPGALPVDLRPRLEALAARLPELLPARPPASLLHGDLWSGNALFSSDKAWMIDPACYYGHGEVDLAMLTLFASPPRAFWQAYGSLEPGWQTRRAIYQLWPALVHLRLFGAGYRNMVESRLNALGV